MEQQQSLNLKGSIGFMQMKGASQEKLKQYQ
jgi:hypothetical protein